jgi:GMP synthase (glutamine-hydrolysing)
VRALTITYERDAGPGVFAEALRAHGVEPDSWLASDSPPPPGDPSGYDAVLVFGGSMHADQEEQHPWLAAQKALLRELLDRDVPILGVCLGAQLLSEAAGAPPSRMARPEIGWYEVEVTAEGAADSLVGPLAPAFEAFAWHRYECPVPPGAVALAHSHRSLQAFRVAEHSWGIQFHAEVSAGDVEAWMDDYRADGDDVLTGLDIEELRDQTRQRIAAWNELGRELCGRFVDVVEPRYPPGLSD